MENKKNKQADLSKRSILFFQVGLILSLLLVWQLIEWKADGKEVSQHTTIHIDQFEEDEIPITRVEEVKPPEPPQILTKDVEVIPDELEKEETDIAPTEPGDKVLEVHEIKVADEDDEEIRDYDMLSVETVPVFPGCEAETTNKDRRECMSEKVNKLVGRTFNASIGEDLGLSGLHRIYVSFRIDKDGKVNIIGARGPHPKLEAEAIRVVERFPEMIPGKMGGRPVGVTYTLPIVFKVQD
ncbi:energy transducer TonB [Salinimicrobium sp. CDJ15-81-2]|nr:energy transducer TonB [Salinimicrobium nanhaiense]